MTPIPAQPILSVIGPHSGCGKTSFVTHLVRHFAAVGERIGCLKVSPAHDWPDDVAGDAEATGEDYYLEGAARIHHPGKDTTLYTEAGAADVKRLRHRENGLAAGLAPALRCFPPNVPVVVESSSAVPLLNPVAVVLVVRPPLRDMKASTQAVLSRVTDLLVNASDRDGFAVTTATALKRRFTALRPQHTWSGDLICEPPPAEMLARLQTLLAPAAPHD